MPKHFRTPHALVGLLVAVMLTGCTGPAVVTTTPTPTVAVTPTPTGPPSLSDDDLYNLAVSQYQKLYAILTGVEKDGGAPWLPDDTRDLMMDPAYTAYGDHYMNLLFKDIQFIGEPEYSITAMARLDGGDLIDGTVVALQTCELFQGASVFDKDGNTLNDGTPTMNHIKAYFKYDPTDEQLKAFVVNREEIDICPF